MKRCKFRNDLILVGIILGIALIAFLIFRLTMKEGSYVAVLVDGQEQYRYALTEAMTTEIRTEDGVNLLVIEDGKAYVSRATCPDGICTAHRPISSVGETIVCLPHKVVIAISEE